MNILKLFIIILFLFACTKSSPPKPQTTSLKIIVTDSNGNLIQGASVKLFLNVADIHTGLNQIGKTAITDLSGSVLFDSLQAVKYFFYAGKGCMNNQLTLFPFKSFDSTFSPLTTLTENQAKTALLPTGSIKYINYSGNAYAITWLEVANVPIPGGSFVTNLNNNDSISFLYKQIGEYKTKISQLGGSYISVRVDTVLCGDTLAIHLP